MQYHKQITMGEYIQILMGLFFVDFQIEYRPVNTGHILAVSNLNIFSLRTQPGWVPLHYSPWSLFYVHGSRIMHNNQHI